MDLQTATDYVQDLLLRQNELYDRIRNLESQVLEWKKRATSLDVRRPVEVYLGRDDAGQLHQVMVLPEWGETTGSKAWLTRIDDNHMVIAGMVTMELVKEES